MTTTASPAMNPIIAERRITTSVPVTTDGVYCDHVWQLATQISNSSGRKKPFLQGGRALVFREDIPEPPEDTEVQE